MEDKTRNQLGRRTRYFASQLRQYRFGASSWSQRCGEDRTGRRRSTRRRPQRRQPRPCRRTRKFVEALDSLRRARKHMAEASHDFGGHRAEALRATDNAIAQLEICLRYE